MPTTSRASSRPWHRWAQCRRRLAAHELPGATEQHVGAAKSPQTADLDAACFLGDTCPGPRAKRAVHPRATASILLGGRGATNNPFLKL
eukprot:NODE_27914_length_496_cov_0.924119.p4 GENE.NODE_27914_length_496_cov_0.924119~~NODE_27914_length_496_cov_0.924119.p4  ORF type:complete len:89 (-),score=14.13 NODE_27914_length_496_cov_0.924119:14-280(-)